VALAALNTDFYFMGFHMRVIMEAVGVYAHVKCVDYAADEPCVTTFSAQLIFTVKCAVKISVL
jgi:hypothetical protein